MKKKKNVLLAVMVTALVFASVAGGCDIYNPAIDPWWVGETPEGGPRNNLVTPIKFYTITFKSGGGDYIDLVNDPTNSNNPDDPPPQRIQAGQKVAEPGLVENTTDKYIGGWYIDVDGDGIKDPEDTAKWDFNNTSPTSDMTLVAGWDSTGYDITFDLNAGSTGITGADTTYYNSSTNTSGLPRPEFIAPGNILSIPKWFGLTGLKANDYVFYGWYTDPDPANQNSTTLWDFTKSPTGDMTLWAGWGTRIPPGGTTVTPPGGGVTPVEVHEVDFVANTGNSADDINDQQIPDGQKIPPPNAITRDGYVFSGWYKDGRFKTPYNFDTPVTGPMILYAKWEPEPYTFPWFTDKFFLTNDYGMPDDWYPFQCKSGEENWVQDGSGDPDDTANFDNQMSVVELLQDDPSAIALIVGFKDGPSDPDGTEAAREESARGNFDDMGVSGQLFKYTDYNPPAGALTLTAGSVPGTPGTSSDEVRIYVFSPKTKS